MGGAAIEKPTTTIMLKPGWTARFDTVARTA
jgi:hypothetical protein